MNGMRSGSPEPTAAAMQQQMAGLAGAGMAAASGSQSQLPQALQNLQRILQSQLASVSPIQLQQAIQRQQVRYSPLPEKKNNMKSWLDDTEK